MKNLLVLLLTSFTALMVRAEDGGQQDLALLTSSSAIRKLKPFEAQRGYPVQIRAVVTYTDYSSGHFFAHDSAGEGIYVDFLQIFCPVSPKFPRQDTIVFDPGEVVEIVGVTGRGGFAPVICPKSIRVLKDDELKRQAIELDHRDFRGKYDSQLVSIRGIVRRSDIQDQQVQLILGTMDGRQRVLFPRHSVKSPLHHLVDAEVLITGVGATSYNSKGQLVAMILLCPGPEAITLVRAAPVDLRQETSQTLEKVFAYNPDPQLQHRVLLRGVVALTFGEELYIREADGTPLMAKIVPGQKETAPGDLIHLLGFPSAGLLNPSLEDATFKVIGASKAPVAVPVTIEEILSGSTENQLVQIAGSVLDQQQGLHEYTFVIKSGNQVFRARLQGNKLRSPIANGVAVNVSGICRIIEVDQRTGEAVPTAFELRLRSITDLQPVSPSLSTR